MAINIEIGNKEPKSDAVVGEVEGTKLSIDLNVRRTLDDNLIIFDHEDIDIVIVPEKNKIVTFAKSAFDDEVYSTADRMFKFLVKKGLIIPSSIQGGNVYASLEGKLPNTTKYNVVQHALLGIAKFIEEEKPEMEFTKALQAAEENRLSDPDDIDSTELGEVPHEETKGSIRKGILPFGISSIYRL